MKYLCLIAFLLPAFLFCAVISLSVRADGIDFDKDANRFDLQPESGWVYTTAPGSYQLPVRTVNVILPSNATDATPTFSVSTIRDLSAGQPSLNTPYYNEERYLRSEPVLQPTEHMIYQGIGRWGDVRFARFAFVPALYDKASGKYKVAEQVNISISYSTSEREPLERAAVPKLLRRDRSFANAEVLDRWYPATDFRTYDYLIVTTPALYNAAQQLVTFRQGQGLVTSFADINQVLTNWGGSTPAEKLRNFLKAEYDMAPFTYLLLIGDIDVVPIAQLIPEPNGSEQIPSDFYYSDLSSDFDSDNDNRLGEYDTGMDYTPELMVGRIAWNDATAVSQICARIVSYDSTDLPWKKKALLPAAMLNYANEEPEFERTDGATFMEYSKDTVLRDYQTTTLYEQSGIQPSYPSDYPLTSANLTMLVNTESWGIVSWSAHGSPVHSARKVWINDYNGNNIPNYNELTWYNLVGVDTFDNVSNQDGSVYFCASCQNGMIDYDEPSLGETLIRKKAVAAIAATRNGWYKIGWENPGWGGLSSYNYHFLENFALHGMTAGEAHGYANWLHTQYCLFGDPIDSGGIIWPELQNVYTYLMYGDPAVGYPSQTTAPEASILVWEPAGDTGNTIINGLYDLAPFNVVYTKHLIDTYNYLDQFDAVFCLFGVYGEHYDLQPGTYEYDYLLSYMQQGGKVYMEGWCNWDGMDSLFVRFGTSAPYSTIAHIEQLCYNEQGTDYIWDYDVNPNMYSLPLTAVGNNAVAMYNTYNTIYPNHHIGIWNRVGESRTISSSFNLGGVISDTYEYKDFLAIILDTLDVYHTAPVSVDDDVSIPMAMSISLAPNPFSGSLAVTAKSETPVSLSIYNIKGQQVQSVRLTPKNGTVSWNWNGRDTNNMQTAAGIYLVRISDRTRSNTAKTLKLK